MSIINDRIIKSLDEAIASGDIEEYERLKKEHGVIDITDYENDKLRSLSDCNFE